MIENNQTNSKRGGARKNAGRKPGAATTKTREIANKASEAGLTPLEYILSVMRDDATEPRERGRQAAERILARMRNPDAPIERRTAPVHLVVRESSGPPLSPTARPST